MAFPNKSELDHIRKKLERTDATLSLPEEATLVERLKYELCRKFVVHIRESGISQAKLAEKLKMDRARLNEIVKYKIEYFTLDKLIEFVTRLDPKLEIEVKTA